MESSRNRFGNEGKGMARIPSSDSKYWLPTLAGFRMETRELFAIGAPYAANAVFSQGTVSKNGYGGNMLVRRS